MVFEVFILKAERMKVSKQGSICWFILEMALAAKATPIGPPTWVSTIFVVFTVVLASSKIEQRWKLHWLSDMGWGHLKQQLNTLYHKPASGTLLF